MQQIPPSASRLLTLVALGAAVSCNRSQPSPTPAAGADAGAHAHPSGAPVDVVATVNGVPITSIDVSLKLKGDMHTNQETPEFRKNALEAVIRQELLRQRAVELGLESDPAYQEKLLPMQAQLQALTRSELGAALFRHEISGSAAVTEADARKYFDDNAAKLRSDAHILDILIVGDESAILQAEKDLKSGTAFEEVAKKYTARVPEGQTPWDLGYMKWLQLPDVWRDVVPALKSGETSKIVRGPAKRFWILKVVDRRDNPDVTFESVRVPLMESMKNSRIEQLREKTETELREKAKIVYR